MLRSKMHKINSCKYVINFLYQGLIDIIF